LKLKRFLNGFREALENGMKIAVPGIAIGNKDNEKRSTMNLPVIIRTNSKRTEGGSATSLEKNVELTFELLFQVSFVLCRGQSSIVAGKSPCFISPFPFSG
jgi:hypothetical protein